MNSSTFGQIATLTIFLSICGCTQKNYSTPTPNSPPPISAERKALIDKVNDAKQQEYEALQDLRRAQFNARAARIRSRLRH